MCFLLSVSGQGNRVPEATSLVLEFSLTSLRLPHALGLGSQAVPDPVLN